MTDAQIAQYEICKTRHHEPYPQTSQNTQAYLAQSAQAYSPWKTCRWCGTQYQEVQETRQVERRNE